MKNQFIALCLLFCIGAGAQTDSTKLKASITISEKDPQKVTVIVRNPENEKITIDVYSSEQGCLMSKVTQVNDYRANLDFSTAVDGDYTIEISCRGGERIRKVVTMETRETLTRKASLK